MAPLKQVSSLFHYSRQIFFHSVIDIGEKFIREEISFGSFTEYIETIEYQLSTFLGRNHSNISPLWLELADQFAKRYFNSHNGKYLYATEAKGSDNSFAQISKEPKVRFLVDCLVRKAAYFRTERLDFWSLSFLVSVSLSNYIWKATDLKYLKLHFSEDMDQNFIREGINSFSQRLLNRIPFLTNLTHFHVNECSDKLIATLCKNCKSLESLKLGDLRAKAGSFSNYHITNESIEFLASLIKLKTLEINISEDLSARFLLKSQSHNLTYFSNTIEYWELDYSFINEILTELVSEVVPFRPFNLIRIKCDTLDSDLSHLVPKYFPYLESIDVMNCLDDMPEFSFLESLNHLKAVNLQITAFENDFLDLLSLKIPLLAKLKLNCGGDGDFPLETNTFLEFGLNCPNLHSIELEQCVFVNNIEPTPRSQKPFQNLRNFELITSGSFLGAETILSYAPSIEEIQIYPNEKYRISDEFFDRIFQANPLSKLRKLAFALSDVSSDMFKFLIRRCPKITSIQSLDRTKFDDGCHEISKFISENNYDVSFR